jgi:hypothetical protein
VLINLMSQDSISFELEGNLLASPMDQDHNFEQAPIAAPQWTETVTSCHTSSTVTSLVMQCLFTRF